MDPRPELEREAADEYWERSHNEPHHPLFSKDIDAVLGWGIVLAIGAAFLWAILSQKPKK